MFSPDLGSCLWIFPILDPDPGVKKSTVSRIRNTGFKLLALY